MDKIEKQERRPISGFGRLAKRGIIDEQIYKDLLGQLISIKEAFSKPIIVPSEELMIFSLLETVDAMANELCDLLDWRDKMEGKMDNPPEIEEA